MIFSVIIAIVIGYLLGSIPFAYITGRLKKGVDVRQVGGHNVGALNVMREIGLLPGVAVLIADIGKGSLAVLIASWLGLPMIWVFVAGFAAVLGHNWPILLGFKGGKGAATTLGVLFALVPSEFAISLAIMALVIVITSNIRLAIIIGLALLPLFIWRFDGSSMLIAYSLALSLFLGVRSLPSIREAITSTSNKKNLIFDRDYHFWQIKKSK